MQMGVPTLTVAATVRVTTSPDRQVQEDAAPLLAIEIVSAGHAA